MGRFAEILAGTAKKTDEELASNISSLTKLTDLEIGMLFPSKAEKEKLLTLLEIVTASTDENKRITELKSNIEDVASVVVKLMKFIV